MTGPFNFPAIPGAPACIECGKTARLVDGKAIYPYRPDLFSKRFWLCRCGAYCGCHPGTTDALGSPAGPKTRAARSAAHAAFDPLWQEGTMTRSEAYAWLSEATGIPPERCHIGMLARHEAEEVTRAARIRRGPPDWVRRLI